MGLVVTYYMPADATSGPWTEDLSSAIRLGTMAGVIDEAELGAVGQSSLLFDDPLATLGTSHYPDGIRGLKRLWIDETACAPGDQRLWTGWIYDRRYRRGTDSLIVGVARKLDVTLVDANVMLSFRVFAPVNGSNATQYNASNSFIRPAETDLVRVAALLTVPFLTSIHDTGFISTGTGVAMDACDYTGQHPADVLNDCAQQSGRNFFIRFDESADKFSLHYVDEDDMTDAATLQISNVLADVDNVTTFASEPDAELVRDPSRISAALYLPFNGTGSPAYQTRIQTEYDYGWRDSSAPSSNVKTLAQANVRAARLLGTTSTEDDRITCTVKLPASVVTGIKQGQIVHVKFSHLPNGSNATWGSAFSPCRVLNRNVMANEMTNVLYNVRYELSPIPVYRSILIAVIASEASATGTPLGEPVDTSAHPWTKAVWTGNIASLSQWPTNSGAVGLSVWWRFTAPGESGVNVLEAEGVGTAVVLGAWVYQVSGISSPSSSIVGNDILMFSGEEDATLHVTASASSEVMFAAQVIQKVNYGWNTVLDTYVGTTLASVNLYNVATGTTVNEYPDQYPPTVWIGYAQGSGTLTAGCHLSDLGSGYPSGGGGGYYNLAGRGWGGLMLPLVGTFAIVQQGFGGATIPSPISVSLPSPP